MRRQHSTGDGRAVRAAPPENAVDNFVKVVQRVPIKITFVDRSETLRWISPGMSVEAKIYAATHPAWFDNLDRQTDIANVPD
jgi:membrane fusion protein (multidrug efflux system)